MPIPNYHEGWVEQKDTFGPWKRHWLVLKGNELILLKTGNRGETPVWKVKLDENTEVKSSKADEKTGYQFYLKSDQKTLKDDYFLDVHVYEPLKAIKTKKGSVIQMSKYCAGENDRDLWVAYIDGLAHGDFDRSNKLLPGQKTSVDAAIENWRMLQTSKSRNPSQVDEGIGSEFSGEGSGDSLNCGGPIKNHKFYNDSPGQPRQQIVPSWFFENCSRQLSEMILEKGKDYGNVLMRESVTFKDNGSYVISLRRDSPRGSECEHFEVIQVAAGYQINVENIHHPFRCLKDVMDYFLHAAGSSYTFPFVTNDLATIGIHRPYYQSVIQSVAPGGQTTRPTGAGNSKTLSAKRQNFQRSATMPDLKPPSHTMFGRRSENPFDTGTSTSQPSSLRDAMRRGWSSDEQAPISYVSCRPPAPLPTQATTLSVPPQPIPMSPPPVPTSPQPDVLSSQPVPMAPPPAPVASQPSTTTSNSLEAMIAAKAKLMSQNRRSSLPASPPPPPAPHTFPPPPVPVAPAAPPPPPIPAAPVPPTVPAAPPAPPAPMAPPTHPGFTSKTSAPTPPMVPLTKSAVRQAQVASPPQSLQIGGQQVVFPKLKPIKTPLPPPTKPKGRRSSESDVHTPKSPDLCGTIVESGIVEEDHPSVRDVRAMFDSGQTTLKTKQPTPAPPSVSSPPVPQPAEPTTRNVQGAGRFRHAGNNFYANFSNNTPSNHQHAKTTRLSMDSDYQSFARSTRPLPSLTSDYVASVSLERAADRQATSHAHQPSRPIRPYSTNSVPSQIPSRGSIQRCKQVRPIRKTCTNEGSANATSVEGPFDKQTATKDYSPVYSNRPLSTNEVLTNTSTVEEESIYEDLGQYENLIRDSQYYIDGVSAVSVISPLTVMNTHTVPPPPPPTAPSAPSAPATPVAPPPLPGQGRQPAVVPTPPRAPAPPPTVVQQQDAPEATENREEFKRRLESLFGGGARVPLKSPTAAPPSARLATPLPPTPSSPSLPNQDSIYSEPGM